MGNKVCSGGKPNRIKSKQETTTNQLSFTFTLIWLDDEQKKNPALKHCLKQIDPQIIKLDDSDSCETYIRDRPNDHFILIVCYKLGNILVPEIDELLQLDSVFIYDFLSNDVYKSWMKQCQKITNDVFNDLNLLESSIKDRVSQLREIPSTRSEASDVNQDLMVVPDGNRVRSDSNLSSNSASHNSDTTYYLIWLDINTNNDERTRNELKSFETCQLLTFDNVRTCEQYVFSNPNARFIFIVSYKLGFIITPKIASLKQTVTIIVYSKNNIENTHGSWIDQYLTKVQPVVTDLARLKSAVHYELHKCGLYINESNVSENDIIMDVFNQKEMTTRNLQLEKGSFLWFKLFVEVLIHMNDNKRAHHELVKILRVNYPESNFVADFNQNYTPDKAIEWFTRDGSCLLKELNKALRQQHLDHLFIFRYLINDIYQQLEKEHDKETKSNQKIITLYHSQSISQFEINQLFQANTGELIAINSFMSAWSNQRKAIDFLKRQKHFGLKHILFEIEVDYRKKSNPFAQINAKEDITLFMLGCIFRIQSIILDNTLNFYVLKLELCSDDDNDLKNIFEYMRLKDFIQSETDLITLGSLLYKMGELDKARKYFELILTELDINDPNYACCYDGLGNIENDQGRLQEALKYHQQALDLRMNYDIFHTNDSLIALSHIHIAYVYKGMEDYDKARLHVKKARSFIQKRKLQEDQEKEANCHFIEGSILCDTGHSIEALDEFQQALKIYEQQGMPADHPDLASIYQSMGLCHLNTDPINNNPTLALDYCAEALKIRLKALPHNHLNTGNTYRSVGLAYEQLKEYQTALEFYQKANIIYEVSNKTFPALQITEEDIKRIQEYLLNPTSQPTYVFKTQKSGASPTSDTSPIKFKPMAKLFQPSLKVASIEDSTRRIILLGRSSAIKSSFGKALLAQEDNFMINQDSSSTTYPDESSRLIGFRNLYGTMLMIVDTPSFDDENSSSTTKQTAIANSIGLLPPGPHAFLFVLEFAPDSSLSEESDKQLTESLIKIFGPEVFQYIVFVFTNLEKLQANEIEIELYMKKYLSQAFIDLMKKCENRFIVINNQAPPSAKDASFNELMLIIDRILRKNEGKEYRYQSYYQEQTSQFTMELKQRSTSRNSISSLEKNSSSRDTLDKDNLDKKFTNFEETDHLSSEKVDLESTLVFNNHLIGLSLQPYKHHIAFSQQSTVNNIPVLLKPASNNISNILIACLDVDSSLIASNSRCKVERFDDECVCITYLLSMTNRHVYFIVSNSVGKYIIPLIYQHRCIEQIYIYSADENQQQQTSDTIHFPKIRDCWTDYSALLSELYNDIQSFLSRSSLWSNEELTNRCHTHTLIKPSDWPSISLDLINVEKYSNAKKEIHIVILHCDDDALFHADSQHFHLSEFSDVVKCLEYFATIDIRSVFFIISGEITSMVRDLSKITMLNQIYATYLFVPHADQQVLDDTLCSYKNIGRLFDSLQFLLTCLTIDIKFYLEQPLYMPPISIFDSQDNIKDNNKLCLTNEQTNFAAFQLFLNTLQQAPASIYHNQKLYERCFGLAEGESSGKNALRILKTETDKIFDWFIDAPFLSIIVNSFLQEQFPQNLLDIRQIFMTIDQRFAQLSPTTSSTIVYRVQLISEEDLETINKNVKDLVAFHTYLMATKDLLTARTIARQAADRGLLIIIFQIEIPAQAYILELDNNRILLRFGTIFSIRSIELAPDGVRYGQLKYADSNSQSIQERLQLQVGEQLTWLTLGNYLCALNYFDGAKSYYRYLINTLPKDHKAISSIYNNMGLICTESGDVEQALNYYSMAEKLINTTSSNKDTALQRTALTISPQLNQTLMSIDFCVLYDKMAEIHLRQSRREEALKCYRKALELATDLLSRVRFEQKIKNILSPS